MIDEREILFILYQRGVLFLLHLFLSFENYPRNKLPFAAQEEEEQEEEEGKKPETVGCFYLYSQRFASSPFLLLLLSSFPLPFVPFRDLIFSVLSKFSIHRFPIACGVFLDAEYSFHVQLIQITEHKDSS